MGRSILFMICQPKRMSFTDLLSVTRSNGILRRKISTIVEIWQYWWKRSCDRWVEVGFNCLPAYYSDEVYMPSTLYQWLHLLRSLTIDRENPKKYSPHSMVLYSMYNRMYLTIQQPNRTLTVQKRPKSHIITVRWIVTDRPGKRATHVIYPSIYQTMKYTVLGPEAKNIVKNMQSVSKWWLPQLFQMEYRKLNHLITFEVEPLRKKRRRQI